MSLLNFSNLVAWSVQVAAISGAALLALKVLRLDTSTVRYTFLRLVLAGCLLLPFVQASQPAPEPVSPGGALTAIAGSGRAVGTPVAIATSLGGPESTGGNRWFGLAAVLAMGTLARLLWIGLGVMRLRALRWAGEAAPPGSEFGDLQAIIDTSATIRYVGGLGQPVTFGFRKPVVLLPDSVKEQPAEIQRAVLAHELWHVRRRDWIWTLFEEAVRAMLWFHPGIWLLLSNIQAAREEVVDELTILATGSRRHYVNALLVYADRPPLFTATAFARRTHLVQRVFLISKEAVMSARRVVLCGTLFVAVVLSTSWFSIQAFPLTQSPEAASQAGTGEAGPVERRAKPLSPENPIPRRTYYVPPDVPADVERVGARANITVQVTLDETGHVAETRTIGFAINVDDKGMSMLNPAGLNVDAALQSQTRILPEEVMRPVLQSAIDAALRAVRQWQYAAPAEGPVTFSVRVPIGSQSDRAIPPPPPAAPPPDGAAGGWSGAEGAYRVGGTMKPPVKLRNVSPVYPADAMAARVQGVVILEARIEPDGSVSQARVLRSIPMLDEAAIEAVRQWLFTPTLLDGQAVPVIMTVTINFTLE